MSTCNSTTSACACVEGVVERSSRRRAAEISARYAIWARDAVSVCRLRTPRKHKNESPRNFPGVSRAGVRGRAVPETPNERVSTNSGGFCRFLHANDAPGRGKGLILADREDLEAERTPGLLQNRVPRPGNKRPQRCPDGRRRPKPPPLSAPGARWPRSGLSTRAIFPAGLAPRRS